METKKKRKFNIIDIIFILIVVAAVVIVGYKLTKSTVAKADSKPFIVSFTSDEVPEFAANSVKIGDTVSDTAGEVKLGTVVAVDVLPSRSYAANSDGEFVISSKEGYNKVIVYAKIDAVDTATGISVSGNIYGVGHSIILRAGYSKMSMAVSGITPYSESEFANAG